MSTVKAANLQNTSSGAPTVKNSSGTEVGQFAKAWVSFNGTGTVAIRDDFNVSSITDNGTGDYTVNLTTAMANTNYVVCGSAGLNNSSTHWQTVYVNVKTQNPYKQAPTTSTFRITCSHSGIANNLDDNDRVNVSVFGA